MTLHRTCATCGVLVPLGQFRRTHKGYIRRTCRACESRRELARYYRTRGRPIPDHARMPPIRPGTLIQVHLERARDARMRRLGLEQERGN